MKRIGAVIAAAGINPDFEPMQTLGTISLAERNISTLQHAGIHTILLVTGYKADDLEHHLKKYNVMFFRNPDYAVSEMIDSYRIGISYLLNKCDRILLTPCDIPFFTANTIRLLLEADGDLIQPVYRDLAGHPVILSSGLARRILTYEGFDGLQGAIREFGIQPISVNVDDHGILLEYADAYKNSDLLRRHSRSMVRPHIRVSFVKEKVFFDSRIALLLSLISDLGSVSRACKAMQISYTKGWNMIRDIELQAECELVKRNVGGLNGSSSELTERGSRLLEAFRCYESIMQKHADEEFRKLLPDLRIDDVSSN